MAINNTVQWGIQTKPISEYSAFKNIIKSTTPSTTKKVAPLVTVPAATPVTSAPKTGIVQPTVSPSKTPQQQLQDILSKATTIQSGISNLKAQEQAKTQPQTSQSTKGLLSTNPSQSLNFPGLVGSLVDVSKPSKNQTGLVDDLKQIGQQNIDVGNEASRIAQQYGGEIARVGGLGAGAQAGAMSTGTDVVGRGNAAIASQSASQRMSALASGLQGSLMGTAQQLTAQDQLANAYNAALTGANVQQQQQIGGMGTAAGLGAPVSVAPGTSLVSPLGGEQIAGGLGGYTPYQAAQNFFNLQSSYPDANLQWNSSLSPEQNLAQAQSQLGQSPSYQKSTFGAPGASSFIGGAQLQSAADLTGQVGQIQASANGAEANFDLLLNVAQQGGVNQLNVPILNTLQQNVSRGVASPDAVVNFQSLLQTVRAQYASIIGGGTVTVEALQEAQTLIPQDISISALRTLSENLKRDAQNRIAGIQQQINTFSGGNTPQGDSLFDW